RPCAALRAACPWLGIGQTALSGRRARLHLVADTTARLSLARDSRSPRADRVGRKRARRARPQPHGLPGDRRGPRGGRDLALRAGRARAGGSLAPAPEARLRTAELHRLEAAAPGTARGDRGGDRLARGAHAGERRQGRDPAPLPARVVARGRALCRRSPLRARTAGASGLGLRRRHKWALTRKGWELREGPLWSMDRLSRGKPTIAVQSGLYSSDAD